MVGHASPAHFGRNSEMNPELRLKSKSKTDKTVALAKAWARTTDKGG